MRGDIPYSRDAGVRWQYDQKSQLGSFGFGVFEPIGDVAYFIDKNCTCVHSSVREARRQLRLPSAPFPEDFNWLSLDITTAGQGLALSENSGGSSPDILWRVTDGGKHSRE